MRVAVLSDIHANLPALRAVLEAGESEGVERWLCLGDNVGYYYWPAECLALLDERQTVCIQGNHERLLIRARRDTGELGPITRKYGHGIKVALKELDDGTISWIEALPQKQTIEIAGRNVLMCHGAPWDGDVYVYPDAPAGVRRRMVADGCDLVFFGHSHYPVCWNEAGLRVVNPGSVGQPRNRRPGANWALWNTEANEIELRCEAYDLEPVIAACRHHDPDIPYLCDVLTRTLV